MFTVCETVSFQLDFELISAVGLWLKKNFHRRWGINKWRDLIQKGRGSSEIMLFMAIKQKLKFGGHTHSQGAIVFVPRCGVKPSFSVQKRWNCFGKCPAASNTCQPLTLHRLHLETSHLAELLVPDGILTCKVAPAEARTVSQSVHSGRSLPFEVGLSQYSFSVLFLFLAKSVWVACLNSQKTDLQLTAAGFPQ